MPNRILKETVCCSEEIDALTPEQEVLFYRLMVVADDYGRHDARPKLLASKCYPLKSIDISFLQSNLQRLHDVGLVQLYEVDAKPYLQFCSWAKHQQIRAKRAKFPGPEVAPDITCKQAQADVHVNQSNPIQSKRAKRTSASLRFGEFWDAYPRKTNKALALKSWGKQGLDAKADEIIRAVLLQAKGWADPKYIPHASTWLNGQRWEDEVEQVKVRSLFAGVQ